MTATNTSPSSAAQATAPATTNTAVQERLQHPLPPRPAVAATHPGGPVLANSLPPAPSSANNSLPASPSFRGSAANALPQNDLSASANGQPALPTPPITASHSPSVPDRSTNGTPGGKSSAVDSAGDAQQQQQQQQQQQPVPESRRLDDRGRPKDPLHLFTLECAKQYVTDKLRKAPIGEARALLEDKRKLSPELRTFASDPTVSSAAVERIRHELRKDEQERLEGVNSESPLFKNQYELLGAVMKAFGDAVEELKKEHLVQSVDDADTSSTPVYSNQELEAIFKAWDEISKRQTDALASRAAEPNPARTSRARPLPGPPRFSPYPDRSSRGRSDHHRGSREPRDEYSRRPPPLRYDPRHGPPHHPPPRGPSHDHRRGPAPPPPPPPHGRSSARWEGRSDGPRGSSYPPVPHPSTPSVPPPPPPPPHHAEPYYGAAPRSSYPPAHSSVYPPHHESTPTYVQPPSAYPAQQIYPTQPTYPTTYSDPSSATVAPYGQQTYPLPNAPDPTTGGYGYPQVAPNGLHMMPFNSSMAGRHISIPLPIDFMSGPQEGGRLSMPEPHEIVGTIKGYIIRDAQGGIGLSQYEFSSL